MERLQKVIANLGYCSRRKAEELIKNGQVLVNGQVVNELGVKVKTSDSISVEGNILDNNKNYEYYLLNKPRGVVTTTNDEFGRKIVLDLVISSNRIYPVGRLDYDTTGALLLTNDGNLANKLMHPSSNIEKTYIAKIEGVMNPTSIMKLKKGVVIDGYKTKPAKVRVKSIDKKMNKSIVEITISEGKNHQVKNMFESVGHKVLKLKREKYAIFDVKDLKVGEYRKLTFKEVAILYSLVNKK